MDAQQTRPADFQSGDLVDVQSFGRAEVVEALPGGMLRVRVANRATFQVRESICRRVEKTRKFRTATDAQGGLNAARDAKDAITTAYARRQTFAYQQKDTQRRG